MSKKFSKRETKILKFMALAIFLFFVNKGYEGYLKSKEDLQFQIDSAIMAQDVLLQKLKQDPEEYIRKTKALSATMDETEERILRMNTKNDAQFLLQEDITKSADKAEINLNSLNKRRSKELYKGSELTQLKAYFGFNCSLVNLLDFMEQTSQKDYFMAVDTLNINVNKKRRSRRKQTEEELDTGVKIRGSCVLSTLYLVKGNETHDETADEPGEAMPGDEESSAPDIIAETDKKGTTAPAEEKKAKDMPAKTSTEKTKTTAQKTKKTLIKKPRALTHDNKKRKGGKI